jgi:hypothetical protein
LIPDRESRTTVLRITIHSEGPPARIDSITISGLDRREQQHFLAMFDLKRGQPISQSRCRTIEAEVRGSGRFLQHSCIAVPQILQPELADVFIDVRKLNSAPPLDQILSDSQRRIVNFSEWFEQREQTGYDVILELDIGESMKGIIELDSTAIPESFHTAGRDVILRIVLAASGDMIFETRNRKGEIDVAILMTKSEILLERRSVGPVSFKGDFSRPFMQMTVDGIPDNPKGQKSSIRHSMGIGSEDRPSASKIRIAPVIGVRSLATDVLRELPSQPGEFEFPESPDSYLRIDPDTGRPIEFQNRYARMATATGVVDQFRLDRAQSVRQVSGQSLTTREVDSTELCMAAGDVVLNWLAERDSKFRESPVFRLADKRVWNPLVDSAIRPGHGKRFRIPSTGQRIDPIVRQKMFQGLVGLLVRGADNPGMAQATLLLAKLFQGVAASIELFPFESLPWQLNRDLQLLTENQSAGALKLISRIKEDEFGPLSGLYASVLLGSISPELRLVCARQTLNNLDRFDRDRKWLLSDQTLTAGLLETAAEICRRLEPAEIVTFVKSITGRTCTLQEAEIIRQTLPPTLSEPIKPSLPTFTDALWQRAFRPLVKDLLVQIIDDGTATAADSDQ